MNISERGRMHDTMANIGQIVDQLPPIDGEMTPEELQKRKERCESIMWIIVGEKVPMIWHDGSNPNIQGWFWDFSDGGLGKVYADVRDILGKPPGYAEAVSAHEFSHVEIDFPLEVFTEEELRTPGFLVGFNWADDNAVENHVLAAHNSGREWMEVKAKVSMAPGGGLDHRQKEIIERGLGYIPNHHLFGGMTRQYFLKKEVTGELNINGEVGPNAQIDPDKMAEFMADDAYPEEVRETFKRCYENGVIEDIYREIPTPLSEEEVCLAVAQRRAEIYRTHFWPEYKKLIEEAQTDQNLIEFLKKLIEESENGSGLDAEKDGTTIVIDLDSFPQDIQEEIKKAIEKISKPEQGQDQSEGQSQAGSGSAGSGQTDQSQSGQSGKGLQGSPINELSEDAKEAINQAYDSLTKEEKSKIEQSAESSMGEVDDSLNKEMQAGTNKEGKTAQTEFGKGDSDSSDSDGQDEPSDGDGPSGESSDQGGSGSGETSQESSADQLDSTPKDDAKSANSPQPPPEYRPITIDKDSLASEIDSVLDTLQDDSTYVSPEGYFAQLSESERQEYLKEFQSFTADNPKIQDWSDILAEELLQQLRPDRQPERRITSSPSNAKIKIKEYLREWRVARRSLKWYEREENPNRFSVGMTYLVDLSGSVLSVVEDLLPDEVKAQYHRGGWGEFVQDWFDTSKSGAISATVLGAQLQLVIAAITAQLELHIPTQVEGFPVGPLTTQPFITREEFEEVLGDDRLTPDMQASLWGMVAESGGGTPTDEALMQSYKNIKAKFEDDPRSVQEVEFIVVLTDGQPSGGPERVRATLEAIYKDAEEVGLQVGVLMVGIGPGTDFVNNLIPKMPEEVLDLVQEKLIEIRGTDVSEEEIGYSFSNPAEAAAVYPIILGALLKNPYLFREDENLDGS